MNTAIHPLSQYQTQINQLAKQNGITRLALFGSFARDEQTDKSDIDLLVDIDHRYSLLKLVNIERQLANVFGKPVDLIPSNSLNKHVAPYVQKDLITIYDQR